MLNHRIHNWRKLYNSYISSLRCRYFTNVHRNMEYFINLANYLIYNDVD